MSAFILWILLLIAGIAGGLYSTVMWYRICHGKWGFGLLPYLWEFASSLYSFLFQRCANQFFSVIWLWQLIVSTQTSYTRVNREALTSTTNDPEEGGLDDKSLPSIGSPIPSPKSYVSQLRIWNGIYSQDNILKIFLRPFPFLLSPVVSHIFLLKFKKSELHTPEF